MIFTHLIAASLLTLAGGHAGFHPAAPNFYLELPDFEAIGSAYEKAPVLAFLRDEDLRVFVAKAVGEDPQGFEIEALLISAGEEMLHRMPPLLVESLSVAEGLRWFSLSVSGAELGGLADLLASSKSGPSPELEERIGRIKLRVVMDFATVEEALEGHDLLTAAAALVGGEVLERKIETEVIEGGATASVLTVPGQFGFEVWVLQSGNRLFLGAGIDDLASFEKGGPTLAMDSSYRRSADHLTGTGGVTISDVYFHLEHLSEVGRLMELAEDVPGPILKAVSFLMETFAPGGAVEVRTRSRLVGDRFVTESFQFGHGDGATIFDIAGNAPVTQESFRMVPEEAVACWATTLDRDSMEAFLQRSLVGLCDQSPEECLELIEEQYGSRLDQDIIASLGDEFAFYTMPFSGIGQPKVFVALELEDPESFARGLNGLGMFLQEVTGGAVECRSRPYRKHPFIAFTPGKNLQELAGGGMVSGFAQMTPAFVSLSASVGVMEDRAVISLSSMYTKREMKRLIKGEGGVHALASDSGAIPPGATSYGRTDWAAILAGVYDAVRGFMPLIQQGIGGQLPFQSDDMPSGEIFRTYFGPTVTFSRKVEAGTYTCSEASFGPEIPAVLGAALGTGLLFAASVGQDVSSER
jgi:hypothetical protein